ncbi:hypothetical protein AURDEDRAFT_176706 [Auricularia subglabra TFB-10046 SS5]|uniref:Uncharacterized protein n=1 Tax=Auricularia subglabra (strain TFB-10046 / SS5) TaxID=717982 RepID=J0WQR7_AURST|nr:hypothetical protein AURDEDRAFT_178257 [Auricularia subglabra TFB-10046 SS5]EJD34250.1 hypothetical protein AURDEDRAFT_176706 [Auricularia subglabra TFB-10046 SS5]
MFVPTSEPQHLRSQHRARTRAGRRDRVINAPRDPVRVEAESLCIRSDSDDGCWQRPNPAPRKTYKPEPRRLPATWGQYAPVTQALVRQLHCFADLHGERWVSISDSNVPSHLQPPADLRD